MDEFQLIDEDHYAISIAIETARLFLKERDLSPKEIIGLGKALYALERLPIATKGIHCEFGLFYKYGNEEFSESKFYDFRIAEDYFEISIGGSVYDKAVGSDSISEPGWYFESNGVANRDAELYLLGDSIKDFLNQGAKISVDDDSSLGLE